MMKHVRNRDVPTVPVTAPTLPRHEDGLRYQALAKMILDTLRVGDLGAFHGLAFYLFANLTPWEIRGLALACLLACKEEGGEEVVELVFPDLFGAGMPTPPLMDDELDLDAELWAGVATIRELRAYFAAAYRKLPAKTRGALLAQLETERA
jgi:hypothetical protein